MLSSRPVSPQRKGKATYKDLVEGIKKHDMADQIKFFDMVQNTETYRELGEAPEAMAYILDALKQDGKYKETMAIHFWNVSSCLMSNVEQHSKLRAWIVSHAVELIRIFVAYIPKDAAKEKTRLERAAISVLLNFSENDDMRPYLNVAAVLDKLIPHAKGSLTAGLTCANLVGSLPDAVNDKLVGESNMIEKLVSTFDLCLAGDPDMSDGDAAVWWPEEVSLSVINLCQNDKNKVALVKSGIVPRLVRVVKQENMPVLESASPLLQRERAAKAIWQLAFMEENKRAILDAGAIAALEALRDDENPKLANADTYKAAVGALWQLGYRSKEEKEAELAAAAASDWQHVMISYNWAAQKPIVALKQQLESKGYKVWLDLDSMQGSTLEAMAKAVESSHVFCMAISRKYKESPNCRAEAEYAFNLRKPIIPVLVEPNYRPDGWLGAILGTKMFYDFTPAMKQVGGGDVEVSEDAFNKIVPQLIKELVGQLPKGIGAGPASPLSPVASSGAASTGGSAFPFNAPTPVGPSHLTWTPAAVVSWLEKIGFKAQTKYFLKEGINGEALDELRRLRADDASAFLAVCDKELKFPSLGSTLIFARQLRLLGN